MGVGSEVWQTKEYEEYQDALIDDEDGEITNWYLEQQVKDRGQDPALFCCPRMAYKITEKKDSLSDDPDIIIKYDETIERYGIPVHDGNLKIIVIKYCPWCGSKLIEVRD